MNVRELALSELERVSARLSDLESERDSLIRVALANGASYRAVSERTNMSHTTIFRSPKYKTERA